MKNRMLLVGLVALAVMATGVASASATTIEPKGPFAPLGSFSMTTVDNQNTPVTLTLTCANSTIPGTVNANSSITPQKPTFGSCTQATKSPSGTMPPEKAEVTAAVPSSYTMTAGTGGAATRISFILSDFVTSRNCGMKYGVTLSGSTPGPTPVTLSKQAFTGTVSLISFIGPSPFCEQLWKPFTSGGPSASYTYSPSLTLTN